MVYSFSHKGKRKSNQDYLFSKAINSDCNLHLVVDGMGGYEYGDIASKLVAENIHTYLSTVNEITEKEIQKAVNKSNLIIKQKSDDLKTKIGATLGGAIIFKNTAFLFWVGDVKIIHVSNKEVLFETHSHTLINQMIDNGNVINNIERYKHVVTRSVYGNIKDSIIDCHSISNLLPNDLIIIYSDGVSDILNSYQVNTVFNSSNTIQEGINQVEALCEIEAKDNFSMIVTQV
ncbi:PP2C family protein-serine/threonine phosphatase [Flavobacterium facile]|uniref:PP2C family protein-serine/threonine phosphatase n=1 Tax=Flavobacterium facile TaxID=2893174 RepID=UPI002E780B1B|nr:PP2C family protein-serine/threonine phosphatase [Flavobacterium sp. T-12]